MTTPETESTRPTPDPSAAEQPESPAEHWDVCPNCGARMQVVRCKYRCPRCTYFMSCSEF